MAVLFDMHVNIFLTFYWSSFLQRSQNLTGNCFIDLIFSLLWMSSTVNDDYERVRFYIWLLFNFFSNVLSADDILSKLHFFFSLTGFLEVHFLQAVEYHFMAVETDACFEEWWCNFMSFFASNHFLQDLPFYRYTLLFHS